MMADVECMVEDCPNDTDGGPLCVSHLDSHEYCSACSTAFETHEMYEPGEDGDEEPDQPFCRSCAEDEGWFHSEGFGD